MSGAIATAVVASAVVGAASSIYQSKQQEKAAKNDRERRESVAASEKAEADRIASEARPEGESADGISFGTDSTKETGGSTTDFLVPKTSALGGASGRSGLGFAV